MSIFAQTDSVMIVGGLGSGSGASSSNGGGCSKEFIKSHGGESDFDLNLIMDSNGGPLYSDVSGNARYDDHSGVITLSSAVGLSADMLGVAAYVVGAGGEQFITGRYEILNVDMATPSISIQNQMGGQGGVSYVNVYIGGALDSLGYAIGAVNVARCNVDIYSNLSEVFSNYTLSRCGNVSANSWLKITAFNTSLTDMLEGGVYYQSALNAFQKGIDENCCQTLAGDGGSDNLITLYNADNVIFNAFHFTDSSGGAFEATVLQSSNNTIFHHCKFSNLGRGIRHRGGVGYVIYDCYFDGNISGVHINCIENKGLIDSCCLNGESSVSPVLLGNGTMLNTLVFGGVNGVYCGYCGTIIGCTMYDQTECCININGAFASVLSCNNILMPNNSTVPAVMIESAGGSYIGDYNCYYSADDNMLNNNIINYNCEALSQVMGANDINENPLLNDVASIDYRPVNPEVVKGGRPAQEITGNIGAIPPEYQFISNARTANFGRLAIIRS